jgi:hypothetical protein
MMQCWTWTSRAAEHKHMHCTYINIRRTSRSRICILQISFFTQTSILLTCELCFLFLLFLFCSFFISTMGHGRQGNDQKMDFQYFFPATSLLLYNKSNSKLNIYVHIPRVNHAIFCGICERNSTTLFSLFSSSLHNKINNRSHLLDN